MVRNCLIADNEDSGIFYEISYGLHAHDNVIIGNGFRETPGGWGAGAGISLSSSPECVIERNLIVGNREGFNFREQDRTTPRIGDRKEQWIWNHDERFATTSLAGTEMPRSGAGLTPMTAATGLQHSKTESNSRMARLPRTWRRATRPEARQVPCRVDAREAGHPI